jgi:hypothetical protein
MKKPEPSGAGPGTHSGTHSGTNSGTNKEQIFDLIQQHPEGLDDDDIAVLSGIGPRQQVQQLCTQLAVSDRIRRESVSKAGKRRKIHNFPLGSTSSAASSTKASQGWRRRLANLVAATGRKEDDLLDEALLGLAMKILASTSTSR